MMGVHVAVLFSPPRMKLRGLAGNLDCNVARALTKFVKELEPSFRTLWIDLARLLIE